MKHINVCVLGVLFALACQDPAARVISQYYGESRCIDRLQFTTQPEVDRAAAERDYGNDTCKPRTVKPDTRACQSLKAGETCFVAVNSGTACVQRTAAGFKIDWQCTHGYNETPIKTLTAHNDGSLDILRVHAELSDQFYDSYASKQWSHWALRLTDDSGALLGYVSKDSDSGRRMAALLADGKKHDVMVSVANLHPAQSSSNVEVLELVQENWQTLSLPVADAAKERARKQMQELAMVRRLEAQEASHFHRW